MTKSFRRGLWLTIATLLVTLPLDAVILRALTLPGIGERAHSWASSVSSKQRVEYLRTGGLPSAYVDALRQSLTPDEAAAVFTAKIVNYRRSHARFSVDQEQFLDRVLQILNSGRLYGTSQGSVTDAERAEIGRQALKLFPNRQEHTGLFILGSADKEADAKTPEPLLNRMAALLLSVLPSSAVEARRTDPCGCSIESDWCSGGKHCCGDVGCWESVPIPPSEHGETSCPNYCWTPGCGTLLMSKCNGKCVLMGIE